jgi:hypothetical protein
VERGARNHRDVETLKRIYFGFIPVPWLLAGLLFANGRLDTEPPQPHVVTVVSKFSMLGAVKNQRLVVASWREGRRFERLPVGRNDFDRFRAGDSIAVQIQPGALGIAWVNGVYRR